MFEVYDLECLVNLFTYTGFDCETKTYYQYVIHKSRNQITEIYNHVLKRGLYLIGYNNEAYDYPLLHYLLTHYSIFKDSNGQEITQHLYNKSQEIIESEFPSIPNKNKLVKQIDLFTMWHYNNPSKATGLKKLEYQLHMDNIEDMPIHHTHWCIEEEIDTVLAYNKNDVEATYKFFLTTLGKTDYPLYKGKNKLELRVKLSQKFGYNLLSMPDVRIGETLMVNAYAKATKQSVSEIKKNRTLRTEINLADCIPKWCDIKSPEFNVFLHAIKNTTIVRTEAKDGIKWLKKDALKEFELTIPFHGVGVDFGLGGCHSSCESGIYTSDNEYTIVDLDVSSLYPSISRSLGLYPAHMGPEFQKLYSQFIDLRIAEKHKPKEERDNCLIEGYKLILNGSYGKTNEETSPLCDYLYMCKTTMAGQCFICMWLERIASVTQVLDIQQVNTDGITIRIKRSDLDKVRAVNTQLTAKTGLGIEEAFYKKMIIRDVNNYIAEYQDSTPEHEHVKLKGCFEVDKEYHKNTSMRIVPLALKNYFLYNIPIEKTIREETDIFNFFMLLQAKGNAKLRVAKFTENGEIGYDELSKTTRYYISMNGGGLFKGFNNGRKNRVNAGYGVTIMNKLERKPMKDYKINYGFYIKEANKIKEAIECDALRLF